MRNMAPFRFPYFDPFMAPIYRFLAECPNVEIVNNSAAGAADYADWLGIDRRRIGVILNGIAGFDRPPAAQVEAWRAHRGLPAAGPVVGSVFRFWPEKDPLLWIDTAAAVARRRSDLTFLLIGAGPMRAAMEKRARECGILDRLIMPGTLPDPRIGVAAMDVFLLTSQVEGTPNVLIEAQQLGCPVVTTAAGGSAETLDHGTTGWVVHDRKPQELANRILQVLDDAEWRSRAQRRAPDFVSRRFGIERMVDETTQVYGLGPAGRSGPMSLRRVAEPVRQSR
jgi:glycosyltransferase involved in cell wall biosynthesis